MTSSQNEVPEQVVDTSKSRPEEVPEQEPDKSVTPQSSSEKITKPKNPGRVAAGKRLAEMNRKNKAMKNSPPEHHLNINWGYVLAGGGLFIAAGSLYYAYKEHQRAEAKVVPRRAENPLPVNTLSSVSSRQRSGEKKLMEME